ncbi:MAG TPA: hypothetical protein VHB77_09450 [Planctomycetaceae bacterium]|nr:hypothetical protein [Planctomycetaceae bacterium]
MEVWQMALYGGASLLALRSLAVLMTSHRESQKQMLVAEDEARNRAERAKARLLAQAEKAKNKKTAGSRS